MSMHKTLVVKNRLQRSRNVLTRWERIVVLQSQEKFKDGRSVFGLPKTLSKGAE